MAALQKGTIEILMFFGFLAISFSAQASQDYLRLAARVPARMQAAILSQNSDFLELWNQSNAVVSVSYEEPNNGWKKITLSPKAKWRGISTVSRIQILAP